MMRLMDNISQRILSGRTFDKTGPIGLEVGLEKINLVQCQRLDDGRIVTKARESVPFTGSRRELLGSPNRLKKLIDGTSKKSRFCGRKIVAAIPPGDVRIFTMSYNKAGKSDSQAILNLVRNRVEGGDLANYVVDYLPVRSSKGDEESLAVVALAKKDVVVRYLDALTRTGFDVTALEISPSAIKRLVSFMSSESEPKTTLVINFGRTESYLTMISGRRLLFDQEIAFGENILLQQIGESLRLDVSVVREMVFKYGVSNENGTAPHDVDSGEIADTLTQIIKPELRRLVDEVNRVLVYGASETRGKPVSDIYVMGSLARWPHATALLKEMLQVEVSLLPLPFVQPEGKRVAEVPFNETAVDLAVAMGLSLRGLVDYA